MPSEHTSREPNAEWGSSEAAAPGPRRAPIPSLDGQQRWAAVLFADLENFTGITERVGAEVTFALIGEIVRASRDIIDAHKGCAVEYAGDSILASFGTPVAVENASFEACRAALELQQYMARSEDRFQARYDIRPRLRIGIAGGVIVTSLKGPDPHFTTGVPGGGVPGGGVPGPGVLGNAVNLASRLQHLAGPGEVLCSDTVRDQIEGLATLVSLGHKTIKGVKEPVEVFRLDKLHPDRTVFHGRVARGSKTFYAREADLALLQAWMAAAPPEAGPVDISGPAGIGKSRLVFEGCRAPLPGTSLLIANCNSDLQDKPFAPLIELIHSGAAQQSGSADPKLDSYLGGLLGNSEPGFDLFLEFVKNSHVTPESTDHGAGVYVRNLMYKVLLELCQDPAVIVVLEDIHWIDRFTGEILQRLVETHGRGVKLLWTRRSEYRLGWAEDRTVAHWALGPVPAEEVGAIVADLLQVPGISAELLAFILETTEGNFLFLEETVRYLKHTGQVVVDGDGVAFNRRAETQATAGNLQHLILSRYDQLDSSAKAHVLAAATRGRQFSERFLARCYDDAGAASAAIAAASEVGLIEPAGEGGVRRWRFSHALFGMAIEQSALSAQRKDVHGVVARALDTEDDRAISEYSEELAYHYKECGDAGKAVFYLWKSAERVFGIYAVVEADHYLSDAFALIDAQPDLVSEDAFGEMLVLWGRTLEVYGDFRRLNAIMKAHLPRLRSGGPTGSLAMCMTLQALGRSFAGQHGIAIGYANEAVEMAKILNDKHKLLWANVATMVAYLHADHWPRERILELYRDIRSKIYQNGDEHLISVCDFYGASIYRMKGEIAEAANICASLVDYGHANANARAISFGSNALLMVRALQEDWQGFAAAARESFRYSIPDTGARRVAAISLLLVDYRDGQPGWNARCLLPHADRAREFEDQVLEHVCRGRLFGGYLIRTGEVAKGWAELQSCQSMFGRKGIAEVNLQSLFDRALILLSIAGIEPKDEGGPKPKFGLRDLVAIAVLRIGAVRRAEGYLNAFLAKCPEERGHYIAHVHLRLGLIARARKHRDKARHHFRLSHALFLEQDLTKRAAQALEFAQAEA
ncbi:MAG: AAA family ATPase [Alphaproteobacteria bacterium]|nr:AAA family ATPase [Alphaproteobacteria bacterium]MCB9929212.1 AAA family ATPase [Alphaproteobacteria bacterium]